MSKQNPNTNSNYLAVAQYLFAYARTEDAAKTVQEISDSSGVALSTCHRILNHKKRPVGIRLSANRRLINSRQALQYWYDPNMVAAATVEYETTKQLGAEEVPNHIPNNSTKITPRDLVPLYLESKYKANFEYMVTEHLTATSYTALSQQVKELITELDGSDLPDDRKIINLINFGFAIAQKGIDLNETN